jgi:IS1 family transposase
LYFAGKKENKQWIGLALDTANRQIVAFHVGGRTKKDAQALFDKIPAIFKTDAAFFTDFWQGYRVLESEKHVAAVGNEREKGVANHIERFNNTLRQRCSRLVRQTLSLKLFRLYFYF